MLNQESIRMNQDIEGIEDEGRVGHKIALFADDILTYIDKPTSSIPALLNTLAEYGEVSGYLIN